MRPSLFVDSKEILATVELAFFDKDGTLIDIHRYWTAVAKLRASLIEATYFPNDDRKAFLNQHLQETMGVDLAKKKISERGPIGIKPRGDIVKAVVLAARNKGVEISLEDMEGLFCQVDELVSSKLEDILQLLPNVYALLQDFHNGGIPVSVVTNDNTSRAELAFEILGIDRFISSVIGQDKVQRPKPDPLSVDLCIEQFKVDRLNTVIFGDNPVDIELGNNALLGHCVAVTTGTVGAEKFRDLKCSIVENLESIKLI